MPKHFSLSFVGNPTLDSLLSDCVEHFIMKIDPKAERRFAVGVLSENLQKAQRYTNLRMTSAAERFKVKFVSASLTYATFMVAERLFSLAPCSNSPWFIFYVVPFCCNRQLIQFDGDISQSVS